jgi:hypothetical protein
VALLTGGAAEPHQVVILIIPVVTAEKTMAEVVAVRAYLGLAAEVVPPVVLAMVLLKARHQVVVAVVMVLVDLACMVRLAPNHQLTFLARDQAATAVLMERMEVVEAHLNPPPTVSTAELVDSPVVVEALLVVALAAQVPVAF